jgi:glutamine cyclotransferase
MMTRTLRSLRPAVGFVGLCTALSCACANRSAPAPATTRAPQELIVKVVNSYPHDHGAFTQGLLYVDDKLYESTGLVGQSSLRRVDLATGRVESQVAVESPIFAEGLALAGEDLFQLSWQNGKAFVYKKASLQRVAEFGYQGEGWGLTFDGSKLVMSDGSARLTFRDPKSFAVTGGIDVTRAGQRVDQLNELEWADGQIFANIWRTDVIVRIDPGSGAVTGWIDASGLLTPQERVGTDVLNGIAHAPARGTFFITGKLWPRLFEVKFVAR